MTSELREAREARDDFKGRHKHLGQLALVFRQGGGTWKDFGGFLRDVVFAPEEVSTARCRHNAGGAHHAILRGSKTNRAAYPMFQHLRYTTPCRSAGPYEAKKNPGLVAHDLCAKARNFLEAAGRDSSYQQRSSSPAQPPGESQASDTLSTIDRRNILPEGKRKREDEDDEFGGGCFDDEDVVAELPLLAGEASETREESQRSITTPDEMRASDDTVLDAARVSTKIRTATLGYLLGFADDPQQLRTEFKRLRSDKDLCVLHLCGCGICSDSPSGGKLYGCSEPSHLRLGSHEENRVHRTCHEMLNLCQVGDYARQCQIIHRAPKGEGRDLF